MQQVRRAQSRFHLDDGHRGQVIRDGDTGILTKGDPAALAEAVIGLLLDPERRRAMARRAREMAERLFDVTLQIDRTMAVYADAVARLR